MLYYTMTGIDELMSFSYFLWKAWQCESFVMDEFLRCN